MRTFSQGHIDARNSRCPGAGEVHEQRHRRRGKLKLASRFGVRRASRLGGGCGLGYGTQPTGAAADVEAEFIDADSLRRKPLNGCWNVAFERVAAVRGFASFRGQRNRPGLWCAFAAVVSVAGS
jgi:hypothetical protein